MSESFFYERIFGSLETVFWTADDLWDAEIKIPVEQEYTTFDELLAAINKNGPISVTTDFANLYFVLLEGERQDAIAVTRASGLNVSRILLTEERFAVFGYSECVNRLLANDIVGPELEIETLKNVSNEIGVGSATSPEIPKPMSRYWLDIHSARLKLTYLEDRMAEDAENSEVIEHFFNLGFAAGRSFSDAQHQVTLEPMARHGFQADKRMKKAGEGGAKSSSAKKLMRIEKLMSKLEARADLVGRVSEKGIVDEALRELTEDPDFPSSKTTIEAYLTFIRSEEGFRQRYNRLFK